MGEDDLGTAASSSGSPHEESSSPGSTPALTASGQSLNRSAPEEHSSHQPADSVLLSEPDPELSSSSGAGLLKAGREIVIWKLLEVGDISGIEGLKSPVVQGSGEDQGRSPLKWNLEDKHEPFTGKYKSLKPPGRKLNDADLKKLVVIPEYLAKAMVDAVISEGKSHQEGAGLADNIDAPSCPLLVFINSRSGGQLGPALQTRLSELLSPMQVYNLANTTPINVLRYGVECLDKLANAGDHCAHLTRENLRLMVAGGDGTVGWVLASMAELRMFSFGGHIPPVGIIPLGTGNDLSRSFGWGGKFTSASRRKVKKWLVKTVIASVAPLDSWDQEGSTVPALSWNSRIDYGRDCIILTDSWQVVVTPSPFLKEMHKHLPHCLHPQRHVPLPTSVSEDKDPNAEGYPAFEGLFWNYLSIGMDAQVAYGFHKLRDDKPWIARGRVSNQMIYSSYGCTQGWFCTSCSTAAGSRRVNNIVRLLIRHRQNSNKVWEEVYIPDNIRAILILNLQSYAGGRNPWGQPGSKNSWKNRLEVAKVDDGLLEIVGLRDGWHLACVMINGLRAVRLCQAEAVRLELAGDRLNAYLQMDGEPWRQPLGRSDEPVTVVEIERNTLPSLMLLRQ